MRIAPILALLLIVSPCAFGHGPADSDLALLRELEPIFEIEAGGRVADRRWRELDIGGPDGNYVALGWLMDDTAGFVRLLDSSGKSRTFRLPSFFEKRALFGDESLTSAVWRSKDVDFAKHCRELLKQAEAKQLAYDNSLEAAVSQARLACWALQRGELDLAQKLAALARATAKRFGDGRKEKIDLVQAATADVATNLTRIATECAFSGQSRTKLLAIWQAIDRLPAQALSAEAKQTVRDYRDLIAEDRAWNEPDKVDPSKLPVPDQVAYWMHRLRDANVLYEFLCMPVNRNMGLETDAPSPDERLVALGPAAIPSLLEHMDDSRPTRSVYRSRHGAIRLIRYSEYCRHIFSRIAGRWLDHGYLTETASFAPAAEKDFKEKAEAWWRDYRQLGAIGVLRLGVEAGDDDSPALATKLIERNPALAADAIAVGMRRAKGSNRLALVQALHGLDARQTLPPLLEELSGPERRCRIAAAAMLAEAKQPLGIAALLREWQDLGPGLDGISDLIDAAVASEEPTLLQALGDRWLERPASVRRRVVEALAASTSKNGVTAGLIDGVLAAALDDGTRTEDVRQFRGRRRSRSMCDPAIRDLAAEALADRWAEPEMFDLYAGNIRRMRARQLVKNEWLARSGKDREPLEPVAKIESLDESKVRPLVDAWSQAGSAPERSAAAAKIEGLGLAAVDALRKIAKDENLDGPTRAFVANVRQRLARILREACSQPGSLPMPADVRKLVDDQIGRPLDAERFEEMLRGAVAKWPAGATTLSIALEREEDEPGFVLSVSYLPGVHSKEDEMGRLRFQESLLVGGHLFHETSGMHPGCGRTPDGWTGLALGIVASIQQVLESDPDSQVIGSIVYGDSVDIRRTRFRRW